MLIGCPDMGCGFRGLLRAPSSPLHLPLASLPVSTSTAPPPHNHTQVCHSTTLGLCYQRSIAIPWSGYIDSSLWYHNAFGWEWQPDTTEYYSSEFEDAVTRPVAGAAQFPG